MSSKYIYDFNGNMIFDRSIAISSPFSSGVAYVDNNYIFTTSSGLAHYITGGSIVDGDEGRDGQLS
jgi:hypothetical protein